MQTKKQSLIESVANVAIGYLVAVMAQILIFPLFDITASAADNFAIAFLFTIVSTARSYLLRRAFNGIHGGKHEPV